MKLGIIRNQKDAQAFTYAKEHGLSFVELCLNFEPDTQQFIAQVPTLKKRSEEAGIPLASIGRWNASPLDEQGKVKPHLLEEAKRTMDGAAALKCPVYVCGVNYVEGLSLYRNYSAAIDFFGQMLDYARPLGLKVAVYNCDWNNWIHGAREWEVVLGELPELGIKFDASHAIAGGRDYLGEMRDWAGRFYHVHVKGYVQINGKYVDASPAGLDGIDWHTVMAILYANGYDAGLSIEPHSSVWQGDLGERGIAYTIRYMKKLIV
ncbi:MAG: sugar phosphate isomerase/epimerase family protein [Eubacteriales bacterium]|jgi:sugar phosphate isomerase/epimerase